MIGAVTSLVNFLFQITVARHLTPAAYGLFASLMVLITAVAAGAAGLQVLAARAVSTEEGWLRRPRLVDLTTRQTLVIATVIGLLGVCLSPLFASALQTSIHVVLVVALLVPILSIQAIFFGKIQGTGAVYIVSALALFAALLKLLLSMLVSNSETGVTTLLYGLVVIAGFSLLMSAHTAKRAGSLTTSIWSQLTLVVVIAQGSYWLLASLDVFVVRLTLPESDAGVFAAAATLAKTVLFIPGLLTAVLLPRAGALVSNRQARQTLGVRALGFTAVVCVLTAALLSRLSEWTISHLIGPAYSSGAIFVGPLAAAYIPLALASVVLQFHFTSMRRIYALSCLTVLLMTILAVTFLVPSAWTYIIVMAVGGTLLLAALLLERAFDVGKMASHGHGRGLDAVSG